MFFCICCFTAGPEKGTSAVLCFADPTAFSEAGFLGCGSSPFSKEIGRPFLAGLIVLVLIVEWISTKIRVKLARG